MVDQGKINERTTSFCLDQGTFCIHTGQHGGMIRGEFPVFTRALFSRAKRRMWTIKPCIIYKMVLLCCGCGGVHGTTATLLMVIVIMRSFCSAPDVSIITRL